VRRSSSPTDTQRLVAVPRPQVAVALTTAFGCVLISGLRLAQWLTWGGPLAVAAELLSPRQALRSGLLVLVVDLVCSAALVVAVTLVPTARTRSRWLVLGGVVLVVATVRTVCAQAAPGGSTTLVGLLVAWCAVLLGFTGVVAAAELARRTVRDLREIEGREAYARGVVQQMEQDDAERRRALAQHLHGTVQNHLVVVTAGLEMAADLLENTSADQAAVLRESVETLERLCEEDLSVVSDNLCPAGSEASLTSALAGLLDRLPSAVRGVLDVGPTLRSLVARYGPVMPFVDRLLAFQVIEESVTNAFKHGGATRLDVLLDLVVDAPDRLVLVARVRDDGRGLGPHAPTLRGLARLQDRVGLRGGRLELADHPDGGADLRLLLPFTPQQPVRAAGDLGVA
jgi:signal transduction histidine kinase